MKRFLMFLVIAIAVVSLGLTVYYFSVDNELIFIKSSYLVVDKGDSINTNNLLDFRNQSKYTTIEFTAEDKNVNVDVGEGETSSEETKKEPILQKSENFFLALKGGESQIVVTTNNRSFSRLVIDVLVCDGSEEYPFEIKSEAELEKIGDENFISEKNEKFSADKNYFLSGDIELKKNWKPLSAFSGSLDGNHFAIKNMKITNEEIGSLTSAGLFSSIEEGAVIKNLFLDNVDINTNALYVGSFAGINKGTIQTSEARNAKIVSSTKNAEVGGITGQSYGVNSKIDRCGYNGEILIKGEAISGGGLVGVNRNAGQISESYVVLTNFENGADTDTKFGGLIGKNSGNNANVYDCFFYVENPLKDEVDKTRMAGLVYDQETKALITGCYFGGIESGFEAVKAHKENVISKVNKELNEAEFKDPYSFKTATFIGQGENNENVERYWNFDTIWSLPNNSKYPVLNVYSAVGSTYVIDLNNIATNNSIENADELYNALSGKNTENKAYSINATINEFVIGSEDRPIPEVFNGVIKGNCVIKKLIIDATNIPNNGAVGLVQTLDPEAIISGIKIEDVTIKSDDDKAYFSYVGVIAGLSRGADISDIEISNVKVKVSGSSFGTVVGKANKYIGNTIRDIKIDGVYCDDQYYNRFGGIVGLNLSDITATKVENSNTGSSNIKYNLVNNVEMALARYSGGIVGENGGTIKYSTATNIKFSDEVLSSIRESIYDGQTDILVGGIVGRNGYRYAENNQMKVTKGDIVDVYANININSASSPIATTFAGGIVGDNYLGSVTRASVKGLKVNISGSYSSVVGGIVGRNKGTVNLCVVDTDSEIKTSTNSNYLPTVTNSNYILNTQDCSIVGGIVGRNSPTVKNENSIEQCATFMKTIQGYYAGGIVGITHGGNITKSYCGDSTKEYGGVNIKGYMTGGITAIVASGNIKYCYTFANLYSVEYKGKYQNILNIYKMEVSSMGGLSVLALNTDAIVENCYAVTKFNGNGKSFGSAAVNYNTGKVRNCAYQNAGDVPTPYGTQISEQNFKGADGYQTLYSTIGGINGVWNTDKNLTNYIYLDGLNLKATDCKLPK